MLLQTSRVEEPSEVESGFEIPTLNGGFGMTYRNEGSSDQGPQGGIASRCDRRLGPKTTHLINRTRFT